MAETRKAQARRSATGWFDRYAPADRPGIDIGAGPDPLYDKAFRQWDLVYGDGDATLMEGVPDNSYYTVYASHVLEHLYNPITAIRNWYRILSPGGHLIILVPHRDLYEKKKDLPSWFNADHKSFWLPDRSEEPVTKSLIHTAIKGAREAEFVYMAVLSDGYERNGDRDHPGGELSIELVLRKPPRE